MTTKGNSKGPRSQTQTTRQHRCAGIILTIFGVLFLLGTGAAPRALGQCTARARVARFYRSDETTNTWTVRFAITDVTGDGTRKVWVHYQISVRLQDGDTITDDRIVDGFIEDGNSAGSASDDPVLNTGNRLVDAAVTSVDCD